MKKINVKSCSLIIIAGLATACSGEYVNKEKENKVLEESKETTTFQSGIIPSARTSMEHIKGGKGKFFWEAEDILWVDNGGNLISSTSSSITEKTTRAKFFFTGPGLTAQSYPVYYTGKNSTKGNEVTIAAVQKQSAPNKTEHLGVSGDCGTDLASKDKNGVYKFQLKHKAAYLCFLPHSTNAYIHRSKLIKIEIEAEDNIAGSYSFTTNGLSSAPVSGGTKTITLITGSDGFPVTNTDTDIDKNGAYAVIAPGTHKLTIRYWLKNAVDNIDDMGNVATIEGTITKNITSNFEAGKIYDITANLNPVNYDNKYYLWDAKEHYWFGYENDQPTINMSKGSNYPKSATSDPDRWYNTAATASYSCKDCPNLNEISWYVEAGDPHDDKYELWTCMGHLYRGGSWFKKKKYITGFSNAVAVDGRDYRQPTQTYPNTDNYHFFGRYPTEGRPTASIIDEYFYIPHKGWYTVGHTQDGHYFAELKYLGENIDNRYYLSTPKAYLSIFSICIRVDAQASGPSSSLGAPIFIGQ